MTCFAKGPFESYIRTVNQGTLSKVHCVVFLGRPVFSFDFQSVCISAQYSVSPSNSQTGTTMKAPVSPAALGLLPTSIFFSPLRSLPYVHALQTLLIIFNDQTDPFHRSPLDHYSIYSITTAFPLTHHPLPPPPSDKDSLITLNALIRMTRNHCSISTSLPHTTANPFNN
jgi:hypothetical protein